jgi:Flp pilus assembly protein TadD
MAYGGALIEAQRWTEAVAEFDAALRLDPPNPSAQYGKGVAFDGAGAPSEATRSFEAALRCEQGAGQPSE